MHTNFIIGEGPIIVNNVTLSDTIKEGDKEVAFISIDCRSKYINCSSWSSGEKTRIYLDANKNTLYIDERFYRDKDFTTVQLNDFSSDWRVAGIISGRYTVQITLIKGFLI